jgi:3-methyladenine DNA glycosylase Tag
MTTDWAMVAYHDEEWGMPTYDDKYVHHLIVSLPFSPVF